MPPGREPRLGSELTAGDEIVLVDSSGLHANGSSLARSIAERLPDGYATAIPDGRAFGDALLDRSVIYVGLVRALLDAAVEVHDLSHITGHGFLKLMRPRRELSYVVERLPPVPPVLAFIVQQSGMSPADAYTTLEHGSLFAAYCAAGAGEEVVRLAEGSGLSAHVAGRVAAGPKRVVLEPLGVVFESDDLDLTPRTGP